MAQWIIVNKIRSADSEILLPAAVNLSNNPGDACDTSVLYLYYRQETNWNICLA